ncbi:MAG: hypothetical protein HYV60_15820, partial [Planctomycetia bacterium]|nr:hypothetical protein [Planctomycetia bacterium]
QRDQLPELDECRERLRFVGTETPTIHLSLLDLQDERELLDDREAVLSGVLARLSKSNRQYDDAYFAQMVAELLTTKEELLSKLIRDHDEYLRLLSELEVAQKELVTRTEESESFIDERVLWIRSSDPIGREHFNQAWAELQDLSHPAEWAAVSIAIKNRAVQRPLLAVLAVLAIFLMILCRDRFRRQINRICEADPDELRGHFLPTVEAVVAASLATAFWPGLMWLVGWQLKTTYGMPDLGTAVGQGLRSAAYVFWLCRFARQLCRESFLAVRDWNSLHFLYLGGYRLPRRRMVLVPGTRWLSRRHGNAGGVRTFLVASSKQHLPRVAQRLAKRLVVSFEACGLLLGNQYPHWTCDPHGARLRLFCSASRITAGSHGECRIRGNPWPSHRAALAGRAQLSTGGCRRRARCRRWASRERGISRRSRADRRRPQRQGTPLFAPLCRRRGVAVRRLRCLVGCDPRTRHFGPGRNLKEVGGSQADRYRCRWHVEGHHESRGREHHFEARRAGLLALRAGVVGGPDASGASRRAGVGTYAD